MTWAKRRFARVALLVLGIVAGLGLAELTLYVVGEIYLSRRHHPTVSYEDGAQSLRILCLGESTTAGLMAGPEGGYPLQLERLLSAARPDRRFEVINEGRPAIDTTYIVEHLEENLDRYRPHIVVAMIGINDGPLDAPEFQVGGGPRLWKLARLLWMTLWSDKQEASPEDTWAVAFRRGADRKREDDGTPPDPASAEAALRTFEDNAREDPATALDWARKAVERAPDSPEVRARLLLPWVGLAIEGAVERRGQPDTTGTAWVDRGWPDPLLAMLDGMMALRLGANRGALDAFRRSFASHELSAMAIETYVLLANKLADRGETALALQTLEVALESPRPSDRALGLCARLRSAASDPEGAERCLARARELQETHHNRKTRRNYQRLRDVLRTRGIPLIAMQYPTRSIASLERILGDEPGVYYVSNAEAFREATTEEGRAALFVDLFAGDFGHLTAEGNRRVAQNLADTILGEVLPRLDASAKPEP